MALTAVLIGTTVASTAASINQTNQANAQAKQTQQQEQQLLSEAQTSVDQQQQQQHLITQRNSQENSLFTPSDWNAQGTLLTTPPPASNPSPSGNAPEQLLGT